MPTLKRFSPSETPKSVPHAPGGLRSRNRLAAQMGLLLAAGPLFILSGCAAPSPPRPPSAKKTSAVAHTSTTQGKSASSGPAVSSVSGLSPLAPPQGLEAIAVREPSGSLEVDLSWAISGAADLAGYNVYRSQRPSGQVVQLNRQPLVTPAFRDLTVSAGLNYRYWVTAINAAGDESERSAPVTVSVPGNGESGP